MNSINLDNKMNELHLFAGIGGGIYGGMLLGNKCVGAVEIDSFCQDILRQRQKDGWMEKFPIEGDLTALSGVPYKGKFDLLCGGFPCQAFSTAARGRNIKDKDLWAEMLRFAEESEAPLVLGENVTRKAIEQAQEGLEEAKYSVVTLMLSNSKLGADHQRNRFWLLGVRKGREEVFFKLLRSLQEQPKISGDYWATNPKELGEIPEPVKRRAELKGLGNAQSPFVAASAVRILANKLDKFLKNPESTKVRPTTLAPKPKEIESVFQIKETWIKKENGIGFGFVHTPTTMANYSAKSMMKHKGCRNFVTVFETPQPYNAEWLMGFPIGASSNSKQSKANLKIWMESSK
jgi:site-specific DNA-cytosine methylase